MRKHALARPCCRSHGALAALSMCGKPAASRFAPQHSLGALHASLVERRAHSGGALSGDRVHCGLAARRRERVNTFVNTGKSMIGCVYRGKFRIGMARACLRYWNIENMSANTARGPGVSSFTREARDLGGRSRGGRQSECHRLWAGRQRVQPKWRPRSQTVASHSRGDRLDQFPFAPLCRG